MRLSFRTGLNFAVALVVAAVLVWLCWFQVGNADFWWHVKAGQLIREHLSIPETDPFAYTRAGEPYRAAHSWLAQVFLSFVFDAAGVMGVTLLRMAIVLATFTVLLLLDHRRIFFNGFLAVLAAAGARPGFTDRPQLFTLLLFAMTLALCLRYLGAGWERRRRILLFLPVVTLLWVNLHGAAALLAAGLTVALVTQRLWTQWWHEGGVYDSRELRWFAVSGVLVLFAFLLSPKGVGNVTYLLRLLTDQTASFIAEWQPNPWDLTLRHVGALAVIAFGLLSVCRRDWLFCGAVLMGTGVMMRTAQRHEMLFAVAAAAVAIWQLRHWQRGRTWIDFLLRRPLVAVTVSALLLGLSGWHAYRIGYDINRDKHLYGFGLFTPLKGAHTFLEEQEIGGHMFNNYHAGGELLYRGSPDRKVFLDGRNVDYGYDYINAAVRAGSNRQQWDRLVQRHDLTHAVIYYHPQAHQEPLPYTDLLDTHPDWQLAYLDSWTAVYLRRTQRNRLILRETAMTHITPSALVRRAVPSETSLSALQEREREVRRVIRAEQHGIKGHLYLAQLATMLGSYDGAVSLLADADARQPRNYRVELLRARLAREQGQWEEAGRAYERALSEAGYSGVSVDESAIADMFERAGLQ